MLKLFYKTTLNIKFCNNDINKLIIIRDLLVYFVKTLIDKRTVLTLALINFSTNFF